MTDNFRDGILRCLNRKDGEDGAYSYTSFEIHFNAPIDPETVMDNVSIDPTPNPGDLDNWYREWDHSFVIRFGAEGSRGVQHSTGGGEAAGQRRGATNEGAAVEHVFSVHVVSL